MLDRKRERALLARSVKSKLITQPVEKLTTFRIIEDARKIEDKNMNEIIAFAAE